MIDSQFSYFTTKYLNSIRIRFKNNIAENKLLDHGIQNFLK